MSSGGWQKPVLKFENLSQNSSKFIRAQLRTNVVRRPLAAQELETKAYYYEELLILETKL